MSATTGIQWTDATWNPWHGCTKVSPGCDFCYMYRDKKRYGQNPEVVQRSKTKFTDPLKWSEPRRVFTCSWSDWFHADADPWRDEAWDIIRRTPQHTYQILTKRQGRIARHLPKDWGEGYPNVWMGVSVEGPEQVYRVAQLREIPAALRFVSYEPGLGPIGDVDLSGFAWLIVGGESGSQAEARPFDPQWARDAIALCRKFGVAPFVKQMGSKPVGLTLRDSHGGDMSEWPADLRVREFPDSSSLGGQE